MTQKSRGLLEVTIIYLVTAGVGWWVAQSIPGHLVLRAAAADLAMTGVVFACSVWKTNSSTYDAYWSVIPFLLVVWLFALTDGTGWSSPQWAAMLVVALWSWRLTLNWARGWPGWHHEDWRYVDFRTEHGRLFQLTNFFGIHLFPTAIVFVACLGLFYVAQPTTVTPWLLWLGAGVGLLGVLFEYIADNQLHAFRQRPGRQPGDVLDDGIWGVIRYPNYLGEMLFWWGVALSGLGAGGPWWVLCGAIAMMAMFLFATIPMKDQRMLERHPDFAEYYQRVPALLPRPQRGGDHAA